MRLFAGVLNGVGVSEALAESWPFMFSLGSLSQNPIPFFRDFLLRFAKMKAERSVYKCVRQKATTKANCVDADGHTSK